MSLVATSRCSSRRKEQWQQAVIGLLSVQPLSYLGVNQVKALDRAETDVSANDAIARNQLGHLDANALQIGLAHQLRHKVGQIKLRGKDGASEEKA